MTTIRPPEEAMELKSRWAYAERTDGTALVYATSLGPIRQCVSIAETTIAAAQHIVRLHNAEYYKAVI